MKSNYKKLGEYIREINIRNSDLRLSTLLGVSVSKEFIPSIANTVGTDFSKYKIVRKNQFTYIPDTSRRGDKIGIALLQNYEEALVSQAYTVFEVVDKNRLNPEYLMMWFRRSEFDRYARFKSEGSVREIFSWKELCNVELPIPSIESQRKIVEQYNQINQAIKIKEAINNNLEQQLLTIFKSKFITFEYFGDKKPDSWNKGTFSQLIEKTKGGDWGKAEPTGNYKNEVLCIRGTDIPSIVNSGNSSIPTRYVLAKNLIDRSLSAGDLVVEISGGSPIQSTGRIALITPFLLKKYGIDIICTNFCRALKPLEEYSRFVYYYWLYLYNNDLFFTYENSTIGLKNLDIEGFLNKEAIIIPDKTTAKEFSDLCQIYEKSMFMNGLACEKLKDFQESLLPKLMLENSDSSSDKLSFI